MSRSFLRKKEASGVFLSDRVKQERVSYMKRNVKREVFEKIIETISFDLCPGGRGFRSSDHCICLL